MSQFLFTLTLLTLTSSTIFAQCDPTTFTGEGTYYGYAGGGNCSFPNPYSSLNSVALNASQYKGAVLCGACVKITGEKGSVIASIEDQCPECKPGDIDLEEEIFPLIAEKIKGRVPISWTIVSCPTTGPIEFYFKEGSSQYWTAVEIRNHKNPVRSVEYLENGKYIDISRSSYNYFEVQQGMGPGSYTFRITDSYGNEIIENNIPLLVTTAISGKNQFPDCNIAGTEVLLEINRKFINTYPGHDGEVFLENKNGSEILAEIYSSAGKLEQRILIPAMTEYKLILKPASIYLGHFFLADKHQVLKLSTF